MILRGRKHVGGGGGLDELRAALLGDRLSEIVVGRRGKGRLSARGGEAGLGLLNDRLLRRKERLDAVTLPADH